MTKSKCIAIVLAGGRGKRMESNTPKQYIELDNKPILYYSLVEFEQADFIDEIILVTGEQEIEYCQNNIVDKYGFQKIHKIVAGGEERYHSVYSGLQAIEICDYVFIHDGARPFVNFDIIQRSYETVREFHACVVGVPAKDTIKIVNEVGMVLTTPSREQVWMVQTPQVFEWSLVKQAYEKLMETDCLNITDDAMVVETMLQHKVKLVMGSYRNIKVTTPSDLLIAQAFLKTKNN
jgi:2-C-methyl-D-erythritol 4-phosphate cytidylyltransferase